jgi:hypothetical protein
MNNESISKNDIILNYLNSQSRNKIVFYKDYAFDFDSIDLGCILSNAIYNLKDDTKISMKVSFELDKIFNDARFNHCDFGKMIAITNLGILFESELKQDIKRIFEKHSNDNVLFVEWYGEIENDNLYFLTKENGIKININELSHIVI